MEGKKIIKVKLRCKSCSKLYTRLISHLNLKHVCRESYSDKEIEEIRQMAAITKKQNLTNGKRPQMIDKAIQVVEMDESEAENCDISKVHNTSDDITKKEIQVDLAEMSQYEKIRQENITQLKKKLDEIKESLHQNAIEEKEDK